MSVNKESWLINDTYYYSLSVKYLSMSFTVGPSVLTSEANAADTATGKES